MFEPALVTTARVPSGVIAMSLGLAPTVMVATTALVAVSITETVPDPLLVTYARVPSGLTATALGAAPTVMVVIRFLVARSITDTVPAPLLATYARLPEIATADGEPPVPTDPSLTSPGCSAAASSAKPDISGADSSVTSDMVVIALAGGSTLCCTPNSRRAAAATAHVSGESTGAFGSLEANGDNNAATAAGTAASPLAATSSLGSGAADMLGGAGSVVATTSLDADRTDCLAAPLTSPCAGLPVEPVVGSESVTLTACRGRTGARWIPDAMPLPTDGSAGGAGTASATGVATSGVWVEGRSTSEVWAPPELDTDHPWGHLGAGL